MQSVHITINVVSSNYTQARCTGYTIMWLQFASDLWQVDGFSKGWKRKLAFSKLNQVFKRAPCWQWSTILSFRF